MKYFHKTVWSSKKAFIRQNIDPKMKFIHRFYANVFMQTFNVD